MKLQVHRDIYIPDYDQEVKRCTDFITTFADPTIPKEELDPIHGNLKYMRQLQEVINRKQNTIAVEMDDLSEFFLAARDRGFVERIQTNTTRYVKLFSNVIDQNLPLPSVQFAEHQLSAFDIVMQ